MTRRLSLSALNDESVFVEIEEGESKLVNLTGQTKCTLTDLLNSEGVKDDRYMMWVQSRLINAEKELKGYQRRDCERRASVRNIKNSCPTSYTMSTVTIAVSKDHRELANYYKKILDAPNNDIATRWQNQFIWALTGHLVAEELVLYPAFENILANMGRIIVDRG